MDILRQTFQETVKKEPDIRIVVDILPIVHNQDTPGHVATVSECLSAHGVNIATMQLYRSAAGGYAVMVLECDEPIPEEIAGELRSQPGIVKVTILNL